MQPKKALKVFISVALGALFLWLAFKEVEFSEVMEAARNMSYGWILPFTGLTLLAHYIRAERWRMLFTNKDKTPSRLTLYTGVMFGYLTNIVLPRVGEVARPVYVARQVDEKNSKLIGTIVLERVIDVISMLLIMVFVGVFLVSDPQVLSRLFGVDFTDSEIQLDLMLTLLTYGAIGLIAVGVLYQLLKVAAKKSEKTAVLFDKARKTGRTFMDGILAIRELKNWPLFILYTVLIWCCYIMMTYIPFWMFDMQEVFGLGVTEALVLTMVSAVGISIPTPGGVGTYHLFITKSLFVLFAVPETIGLAYATVAHAATLVVIIACTPVLLAVDKFYLLKRKTG
ncbi:MAG: flippase-like domain-containing protein [Balneolaceae bacterium]|nr:flippase-like domain-containing protein [Balneolaceae bacterium]